MSEKKKRFSGQGTPAIVFPKGGQKAKAFIGQGTAASVGFVKRKSK